jgi:hypothetical protein
MIGVFVFLNAGESTAKYRQGLIGVLVFFASLVTHTAFKPYVDMTLNITEGFGLAVAAVTFYIGLWSLGQENSVDLTVRITSNDLCLYYFSDSDG